MYGRGEGLLIHTLIWIFAVVLLGALAGAIYQKIGLRRDRWIHPPPGRFVDLGTHRLHLLEKGHGSLTIVLEAGLMSTVLSWSGMQSTLSRSYRVVSYDRAGLGWSDLGPDAADSRAHGGRTSHAARSAQRFLPLTFWWDILLADSRCHYSQPAIRKKRRA